MGVQGLLGTRDRLDRSGSARLMSALVSQSWPLSQRDLHFDLGSLLSCAAVDAVVPNSVGQLGASHAGCWECNLTDESIFWSGGVYDIFGLPRGASVTRNEAVAFYADHSRVAMERLRSDAIRHGRGFTIDAEIRPASGGERRMRVIGMPVCEEGRPVRLHGLKLIV
jgi:PAS domain-containing protein